MIELVALVDSGVSGFTTEEEILSGLLALPLQGSLCVLNSEELFQLLVNYFQLVFSHHHRTIHCPPDLLCCAN